MKFQNLNVSECEDAEVVPHAPLTTELPKFVDTGVKLWFPLESVTSRTGDRCIVAKVPQWYITYSDLEWKRRVVKVLDKMTIHDSEVRKQLEIAINDMEDWCVSREYGLGTRLPADEKFMIDSLSDSTIYMAYYTVCHLLHRDIYGEDQLVPSEHIDDRFWDAVLLGLPYEGPVQESPLHAAREQFLRYYPPNIRVSGKDLIYNHLVMSIYHHVAIFGDGVFCQEYLINGHAKLNGKKMSKGTGNFITLHDALEEYRTDALRVMLIEAGDGLDDANIRLKDHQTVCDALDQIYMHIRDLPDRVRAQGQSGFDSAGHHLLYLDMLEYCYQRSQEAFLQGKFREAVTYGWRKCTKVLNTYLKHDDAAPELLVIGRTISALTLEPIVGRKLNVRADMNKEDGGLFPHINEYYDLIQSIHGLINKSRRTTAAHRSIRLKLHHKLHKHREDITRHIIAMHKDIEAVEIMWDDMLLHPKRDPYKLKPKLVVI
jgi:leucyl-tRNA synthetase